MGAFPEGGARASLDFYNVHYYDWMYNPTWGYDPCREHVGYWGLDKPTVVAELPATSTHYTAAAMLDCAYVNGFAGDLYWAYKPSPQFPIAPAYAALANFSAAHPALTAHSTLLIWLQARRRERALATHSPGALVPSHTAQDIRRHPFVPAAAEFTTVVEPPPLPTLSRTAIAAEPLTKSLSRSAFLATLDSAAM